MHLVIILLLLLSNLQQTTANDCRCECCTTDNCNPILVGVHPLWYCSETVTCTQINCVNWHANLCPSRDVSGQTRAICASHGERLLPASLMMLAIYSLVLVALFSKVFVPNHPRRSIAKPDQSLWITTTTMMVPYQRPSTMPQVRPGWLEKFGLITKTSTTTICLVVLYGLRFEYDHKISIVDNGNRVHTPRDHPQLNHSVHDAVTYLVPSVAYLSSDKTWQIEFRGWHNRPMNRGVRRYMFDRCFTGLINARGERMSMQYHRERLNYFLVEDLPHTDLQLRVITDQNQSITFNISTDTLGYFSRSLTIESLGIPTRIEYREIEGKSVWAPVIPLQGDGLSVISDIDDTLKISMVNATEKTRISSLFSFLTVWKKRHEMLVYAFQRDYVAVPGMSEALCRWQSSNKRMTFHYVSSMMYQLLPAIQQFFELAHFPQGSFHMRYFSLHLRGSGSRFWEAARAFINSSDSYNHKIVTITSLIQHSQRTFILIGDSGERDPFVYAEMYAKFSERIHHIYIRAVRDETRAHRNIANAFERVPAEKWSLFYTGDDLP